MAISSCTKCRIEFKHKPSDGGKYCSISCYHKDMVGKPHGHKTNNGLPAWNRGIEWLEFRGANHPRWKGNSSEDYLARRRFRVTIQKLVFKRDDYTCQACGQYNGYLQVDHIKSWSKYPELRFDLDNCRTLCMACHYFSTFKRKLPKGVVWGHNFSKRVAP